MIRERRLWAITSYFNPCGYKRRLMNYRIFRERLGVPLIAVELAYGDTFELRDRDAEIVVRLSGRDVMWQKERLLNVALDALPAECDKVAWVDCDVIFGNTAWGAHAEEVLKRCNLAQVFKRVYRLPADVAPDDDRATRVGERLFSIPYAISIGAASVDGLRGDFGKKGWATGFAWAARREILERHRLYDACIAGSADRVVLAAAYGGYDDPVQFLDMTNAQQDHYLQWAIGFFRSVAGSVGYVDGSAFHLWHGSLTDRHYLQRHKQLQKFGFDPLSDIALDKAGCWRWNSDKPQLHEYLRRYFALRREDG